ncbi:MAG: 2OG-Fe dioxygenase family protein [Nevskiales bacterium]|nr:2OG-Fe dioxygenase family protein [Nevskiales bacterium]
MSQDHLFPPASSQPLRGDALPAARPATGDPGPALAHGGFRFVGGERALALINAHGALHDWARFGESWERLHRDRHMADGGRYRRRRHGVYTVDADGPIIRCAHQPHFQSTAYNRLNGGVMRWFEPIEEAIGRSASLNTLLRFGAGTFGTLAPEVARWHAEVHQFRIEALADTPGLPTPEGAHRDGVDYVLVLMIRRHNIASGTTVIYDTAGRELGGFTLRVPFDLALVDDRRVLHGVTPVRPIDAEQPSHRDVLVITYRRDDTAATSVTGSGQPV